jgi:hypothetical protein
MSVALINKWPRIDKDLYIQSEVMPFCFMSVMAELDRITINFGICM